MPSVSLNASSIRKRAQKRENACMTGRLEDGALALSLLQNFLHATLLETHLAGKGGGWSPCRRSTWRGLGHHLVDLLERQALGLWHQEVGVHESTCTEPTPDEEDAGFQISLISGHHVWSDDGDDGVPEPVGCGRESNTTRADWQREDLADQDPGTWAPSRCKEEDEDGDESNLGVDSRDVVGTGQRVTAVRVGNVVGVVEADCHTNDGDEELADQHAESTPNEEWTTTELLDRVEGDGCGAHVDQSEDQRDQEGVGDGTGRCEERSRVVEDEVHASPLLHHLQRSTENGLAQVGVRLEDGSGEAVSPAADPSRSRNDGTLVFLVGNDLGKLSLDILALARLATEAGKGIASLLNTAALDEVTWRVWQKHETASKDDTPDKLNADWNAVFALVGAVADSVVDTGREEQTNGDAELVSGHQSSTDLLGTDLRHVQDDDGRLESDTDTSDETTCHDHAQGIATDSSAHLNDDS